MATIIVPLQININDRDNGILIGRWLSQGESPQMAYAGGVPPSLWAGSEAILSQYMWSKFKPVKYAQCWVFGGALTTGISYSAIFSSSVLHSI